MYSSAKSKIKQVTGKNSSVEGMGIAHTSFPESEVMYLLYPCYHIPDNPQDTLDLPPLIHYNQSRSVRLKVLVWLKVVHKDGRCTKFLSFLHLMKHNY